jgi:hypothetical protein
LRIGSVLDPVEVTVGKTHKGKDDLAFTEARRKRRNEKTITRPIPEGPCCAKCPHWMAGDDEGGTCRVSFVAWAKYADGRMLIDYDQYRDEPMGAVMVETKPWMTCSQFNRDLTVRLIRPRPEPSDESTWGPLKRLARMKDERGNRDTGDPERNDARAREPHVPAA